MKPFDPLDFATTPAPRSFIVKNGDWTCSTCGGILGAVETNDGWETFIPNGCPTQQTCNDRIVELAEFAREIDTGSDKARH
jgi:hypothetical protein